MIGKKLKEIRVRNGVSQEQAAKVLGICRSAYCNYEIGRRSPDFSVIKRLADFYRIPLDAFNETENTDLNDEFDFQSDVPQYLSELSKNERDLIVNFRLLDPNERESLLKSLKEQNE